MKDAINPAHYRTHPSGVECIQITRHFNFCIGNVIKYLWRAGLKQPEGKSALEAELEDCRKAEWYLCDHINNLQHQIYGHQSVTPNIADPAHDVSSGGVPAPADPLSGLNDPWLKKQLLESAGTVLGDREESQHGSNAGGGKAIDPRYGQS